MSPHPTPSIAQLINRASRALTHAGDTALRPLGLRYAQVPVLALLNAGTAHTQKTLAEATGTEQPSMAQLLTRMERDGLIARTPHPRDARSRAIELTSEASARLTPAHQRLDELDRRAVAGFTTTEIRTLIELLTRLNANLDSDATEPVAGHRRE